jgi:hypothetical protein
VTNSVQSSDLSLSIGIGGMTVREHTSDRDFSRILEDRYAGFPSAGEADYEFQVDLIDDAPVSDDAADEDVGVGERGRDLEAPAGGFPRGQRDAVSNYGIGMDGSAVDSCVSRSVSRWPARLPDNGCAARMRAVAPMRTANRACEKIQTSTSY